MANFNFSVDELAKINDFVSIKQPATVIRQIPAAGTPVLEGMTIEIQTVSFSDIPVYVLDPQAPVAIKNIPIGEIAAVVNNDDTLVQAAKSGTVTDPAGFAQKINSGLNTRGFTTTVSATDAASIAHSIGGLGFLSH